MNKIQNKFNDTELKISFCNKTITIIKNFYNVLKDTIKHLKHLVLTKNKRYLSLNNLQKTEDLFFSDWGYAKSTKDLTDEEKMKIFLKFQYSEKAKVALSVASSFDGGHYLEFGSHDLYTLRNFLSAFDVGNLNKRFPNTNFYAFDIFGSYENNFLFEKGMKYENRKNSYFDDFILEGDVMPKYLKILDNFNVFRQRTFLIKGFFEDTLPTFKLDNKVGFAFLDCNIPESYEFVLDWLTDKIENNSYLYFDEYYDQSDVFLIIQRFRDKLLLDRGLILKFVRSAGSVGALFRCFKV